jgi:hypothetical protein
MSEPEVLLITDFSKGPGKIKIHGGCTYDYVNHRVIHNSGPFTSDGCLHTKWQNERALADRVREEYATQIEEAKERVNNPEKRVTVSEEQVLAEFKEQVLESISTPPGIELKMFDWNTKNFPTFPNVMNLQERYQSRFNSWKNHVQIKLFQKENDKARIPKNADAFDSIYIPCVDPQQDVISVTLMATKSLPKDKNDAMDSEFIYNESTLRKVYVPIKTITNLTSQYVRFAPHPIVVGRTDYYIKVEYAPEFKKYVVEEMFWLELEMIYTLHEITHQFSKKALLALQEPPKHVYLE